MRLSPGAIYKGLAEEELLKRVMQNLLKNCLQYSVGEVVVSITKDTDMPVRLPHNHAPGDFICICVQLPKIQGWILTKYSNGFMWNAKNATSLPAWDCPS